MTLTHDYLRTEGRTIKRSKCERSPKKLGYNQNRTLPRRLWHGYKATTGLTDIKVQRKPERRTKLKQDEHAIHYVMYAHVRPYRPQGPCVRIKYALPHSFVHFIASLQSVLKRQPILFGYDMLC